MDFSYDVGPMQALKDYLIDCENKRRRMRNRPSNAVLAQLRALIEKHAEDSRSSARLDGKADPPDSESA